MEARSLTILLYHGVSDYSHNTIENASGKHIEVKEFDRQIRFLRNNCTILSMDDVVDIYQSGDSWPPNAVVVTFDDGFKNNYTCAASALDKYNCPATFYVCAGMINTDLMFWVDEIEDCINRTEAKEITLLLDKPMRFDLKGDNNKIEAIFQIKHFCKKSKKKVKDDVIKELIHSTGVNPSVNASPNYPMMSWRELKELGTNSLFSVGGHTLYHDIMASQEIDRLRIDIEGTISLLDFNLAQATTHFAYPEGQKNHYSVEIIKLLQDRGIICSPSAIEGVNTTEDLFNLKRIMPNFMGREFPYSNFQSQ